MYNFRVILIGDSGVGKTTFLNKLKTIEFEKKYISTTGVNIYKLK